MSRKHHRQMNKATQEHFHRYETTLRDQQRRSAALLKEQQRQARRQQRQYVMGLHTQIRTYEEQRETLLATREMLVEQAHVETQATRHQRFEAMHEAEEALRLIQAAPPARMRWQDATRFRQAHLRPLSPSELDLWTRCRLIYRLIMGLFLFLIWLLTLGLCSPFFRQRMDEEEMLLREQARHEYQQIEIDARQRAIQADRAYEESRMSLKGIELTARLKTLEHDITFHDRKLQDLRLKVSGLALPDVESEG